MSSITSRIILSTILAAAAITADAKIVAGVKFDDSVRVNGQTLVLNGAGVRKKLFIKVYAGALYLPTNQRIRWLHRCDGCDLPGLLQFMNTEIGNADPTDFPFVL